MDFLKLLIDTAKSIDAATLVLLFMLLAAARFAEEAQKRSDFDWGEAFKIDGRVSWVRAALAISVGLSSWVLIYVFMNGMHASYGAEDLVKVLHELFWYFMVYMVIWALGPQAAERALDALVMKWTGQTVTSVSQTSSTTTAATVTQAPAQPEVKP